MATNAMHNRVSRRDAPADSDANVIYNSVEPPTREEIIAELKKASFGTVGEQKEILKFFIKNRSSIETKIGTENAVIIESFRKCIPSLDELKKAAFGAKPVATSLFDLDSVLDFIRRQDDDQRATRAGVTDPINKMMMELKDTIKSATSCARQSKDLAEQAKVITLTGEERDRMFLQGGGFLPQDEAHRYCPKCGHPSVDEPQKNRVVIERNKAKLENWSKEVEKFDECKRKGEPYVGSSGRVLSRRPAKPQDEVAYVQCHCIQFGCISNAGDVDITECPIKCIDSATGERYGVDPASGDCLCPLCQCHCCAATKVSENYQLLCITILHVTYLLFKLFAPQAMEVQRALARNQGAAPTTGGATIAESAQRLRFIQEESAKGAVLAALDQARREVSEGRVPVIEGDYIMDVTHEEAARRVVETFHGDSEHTPFIRAERERIGMPTTVATLQNGHQFDTRQIPASRKKHREYNNRLETNGGGAEDDNGGGKRPARAKGVNPSLFPDRFPGQFPPPAAYNIGPGNLRPVTPAASSASMSVAVASANRSPDSLAGAISGSSTLRMAVDPPHRNEASWPTDCVDLTASTPTRPSNVGDMMQRVLKRSLEEGGARQILESIDGNVSEGGLDVRARCRVSRLLDRPDECFALVETALSMKPDASSPNVARLLDSFMTD